MGFSAPISLCPRVQETRFCSAQSSGPGGYWSLQCPALFPQFVAGFPELILGLTHNIASVWCCSLKLELQTWIMLNNQRNRSVFKDLQEAGGLHIVLNVSQPKLCHNRRAESTGAVGCSSVHEHKEKWSSWEGWVSESKGMAIADRLFHPPEKVSEPHSLQIPTWVHGVTAGEQSVSLVISLLES